MYNAEIVVCVYRRYDKLVNMIDLPRFLLRIVVLAACRFNSFESHLKVERTGHNPPWHSC